LVRKLRTETIAQILILGSFLTRLCPIRCGSVIEAGFWIGFKQKAKAEHSLSIEKECSAKIPLRGMEIFL
jgi:hypothetical protein